MHIEMERFGNHGWEFAVDGAQYRTNGNGDGLWVWRAEPGISYADGSPVLSYQQTHGTCQFGLPNDRKRARRKIRYQWTNREA